ncbi:DNA polymerase III subunit epsilon [Tetragenococcus osmophilus]|uniref:3'-5' exonuclease DinG n=2 Tax=Tetragenococcus osmophilus TaxID=526944 RepID=A0ABM7ABP2_9ENTE|nr:helicase C-terminal domain-containing protein [Tetragenococcus osmophilus]AYW48795.1 DNA polymerase III subunit epsilon [Tetragenococcus osmophilus]
MNTTYAVVDIETTGTDPETDRIIQFGCVLVENDEIISRFAVDINPIKPISNQIQHLTHISNQRVKKALYFEDVAATIYNLLADTTFVAHNIHFDYNFLNHEMVRCGMPELQIPGIDTVELAQIFLPTEVSFRLNDLAESLGLQHDSPHQADSDAEVTAYLLLHIKDTIEKLPLVTLEKISQLSEMTSKETDLFIKQMTLQAQTNPQPLDSSLQVIDGIALRKKEVPLFEEPYYERHYPKTKKEKVKLYQEQLTYRKEQGQLMNTVFRHFAESEEKDLLIEASTGMGKTIGYLLPAAFLATPENPLIISTVSILLQHQLIDQDIPLLNRLVDQPLYATVVKSKSHYIDLQRFKATLESPVQQKQYALYQMGILVWLTQTTTGDLDELNLIRLDHLLFQEITHRGIDYLSAQQPFYQEDFLRHLQKRMAQSNILIINHAFLAQETQRSQPLLPESHYLLIDEAHHLPETMEKVSKHYLDTFAFQRKVHQFHEEGQLFDQIENMLKDDAESLRLFSLYQEELQAIIECQEDLLSEWFTDWPLQEEVILQAEQREKLPLSGEKEIQRLLLYYQELLSIQSQLNEYLNTISDAWLDRQRVYFGEFLSFYEEMKTQASFMNDWLTNWSSAYVHWLYLYGNKKTARLQLIDFQAAILPNTSWYERYDKIIYLGGTLKVPKNRNYFAKKLGIPEAPLKVIPQTYNYEQQAKLLITSDDVKINELSNNKYADYLAKNLTILLENTTQPALVLFTSHEILQKVYKKMHQHFLSKGREILAQGMGGSKEKLLKRFIQSKQSILFGADSFWEGVDLPGDALQLLIVTRLPFENPNRPLIQARNYYLNEQGLDSFSQESLPKAALKLRQGLGRLIRSEKDKGLMILFDRRIVTKSYGKRLEKALPKELPVQEATIYEMKQLMEEFLQNP